MVTAFGIIMRSVFVALLFLFSNLALPVSAQETFSQEPLTIETADGTQHKFTAELALTAGQRQQGLMYRKTMAADAGMLFDFGIDRDVTMWMRNTILALDMLFINRDGTIRHIHQNAVPYSESIIGSGGPVRFVLELNAGTVAKLGIKAGDRVTSRRISLMK